MPEKEKPISGPRITPTDVIYWTRAMMGVVAGLLSGLLGFLSSGLDAYRGVLLAIALYIVTYCLSRYVLAPNLPKGQGHKHVTMGIGSYVMLFLFTWIIYNTLIIYPVRV
jgi:hypothetical protein